MIEKFNKAIILSKTLIYDDKILKEFKNCEIFAKMKTYDDGRLEELERICK